MLFRNDDVEPRRAAAFPAGFDPWPSRWKAFQGIAHPPKVSVMSASDREFRSDVSHCKYLISLI